jgi:hypothetical protein
MEVMFREPLLLFPPFFMYTTQQEDHLLVVSPRSVTTEQLPFRTFY